LLWKKESGTQNNNDYTNKTAAHLCVAFFVGDDDGEDDEEDLPIHINGEKRKGATDEEERQ